MEPSSKPKCTLAAPVRLAVVNEVRVGDARGREKVYLEVRQEGTRAETRDWMRTWRRVGPGVRAGECGCG